MISGLQIWQPVGCWSGRRFEVAIDCSRVCKACNLVLDVVLCSTLYAATESLE